MMNRSIINALGFPTALTMLILPLLLTIGCKPDDKQAPATPYTITIPKFFPTQLNIPADNPMTIEGIALGRYLFYDGRLSGRTQPDSLMSCATCHIQANSFECGIHHPKFTRGHPLGLKGAATNHYMLPLVNLVWNTSGYLWNGSVAQNLTHGAGHNIEDIVWMTVAAPDEIAGDTSLTKTLIQSIAGYPELFEKAFGSRTVTFKNISRAIAQFVRTLISSNSKFDKYLRGEQQLTQQELNGYVLFMTENGGDCFHCHGGDGNPLFTTNLFYNNGKDSIFPGADDRYSVTGILSDLGAYKATTLRNVALTGPYMHDGRFATLQQVLDFYSTGVLNSKYVNPLMHHAWDGGVQLTASEKSDLLAFLQTLSDETFLTNPSFSSPVYLPDGAKALP